MRYCHFVQEILVIIIIIIIIIIVVIIAHSPSPPQRPLLFQSRCQNGEV